MVALDPFASSQHDRSTAIAEALANGQCLTAESENEILGYVVLNYSFFGFGFIPIIVVAAKHRRRRGVENLDPGDPEVFYFQEVQRP